MKVTKNKSGFSPNFMAVARNVHTEPANTVVRGEAVLNHHIIGKTSMQNITI